MSEILSVWTEVMTWVTTSLGAVEVVFYADNKLTFMGTLAVITVAVGVSFLIIGVVQNFLKLRG